MASLQIKSDERTKMASMSMVLDRAVQVRLRIHFAPSTKAPQKHLYRAKTSSYAILRQRNDQQAVSAQIQLAPRSFQLVRNRIVIRGGAASIVKRLAIRSKWIDQSARACGDRWQLIQDDFGAQHASRRDTGVLSTKHSAPASTSSIPSRPLSFALPSAERITEVAVPRAENASNEIESFRANLFHAPHSLQARRLSPPSKSIAIAHVWRR